MCRLNERIFGLAQLTKPQGLHQYTAPQYAISECTGSLKIAYFLGMIKLESLFWVFIGKLAAALGKFSESVAPSYFGVNGKRVASQ